MKKIVLCFALIFVAVSLQAQAAPAENEKLMQAQKAMQESKYYVALHGFEQANKALGGKCVSCLLGAAWAAANLAQRDDSIKYAGKALEAATTPAQQTEVLVERSKLLLSGEPRPREVAQSEADARKAIELQPEGLPGHYQLGIVLMRQSKDEAGLAEMRWVESRLPEGPDRKMVGTLIADPRRARLNFAPEFTAKTSDGRIVTLDQLKGKVVLIDFWATWCPPCRESVPEIKELLKKYSSGQLVVLSVSADDKKENWSAYVAQHGMGWLQSWDKDNDSSVLKAFGVHSFPTYVLMDGEGIVRERINGLDNHQTLTGRMREALNKAIK
jgi:thiol-disulfide isomerase/thioredoxin